VRTVRLLISVRDASEAGRAVAGGAEIVDAKDPHRGSIAPVSPAALRAIRAAVPARLRVSAALGDVANHDEIARAFADLPVGLSFVKLGFRGIRDGKRVRELLASAVALASRVEAPPAVIAVAYADHSRAGALPPSAFPYLLAESGADGLLVDTCFKGGGNLFDLLAPADLAAVGLALEADELSFALGGGLRTDQVRAAAETGATIFGVRGAACRGGRDGEIAEELVRSLADAVRANRAPSPS
jgi:uncharacterized protein (UPF0264 family)